MKNTQKQLPNEIQKHIANILRCVDRSGWKQAVAAMLAEHESDIREYLGLPKVPVMVALVDGGVIQYQSRALPGRRAEDVDGLAWGSLFAAPGVLTDPSGVLAVGHASAWFGGASRWVVLHGITGG